MYPPYQDVLTGGKAVACRISFHNKREKTEFIKLVGSKPLVEGFSVSILEDNGLERQKRPLHQVTLLVTGSRPITLVDKIDRIPPVLDALGVQHGVMRGR